MDLDDLIAITTERLPPALAEEVTKRLRKGEEEYGRPDGSQPILVKSLPGLLSEAVEEVADAVVYLNVVRARVADSVVLARLDEATNQLIVAHDLIVHAGRVL